MAMLRAVGLAMALAFGASGQGAANGETQQVYELSVAGLRVATVGLSVNEQGLRYAARGVLRGSGIIGSFVNLAFDGTARGFAQSNGQLVPEQYEATRGKGDKQRAVSMRYVQGTPQSVTLTPPRKRKRPYDIDPTAQRGTLDPVSAAVALLPDRPAGRACGRVIEIFDGTRRSRITIGALRELDGKIRCAGVYERVSGYSPRSMREQTRFNFMLNYRRVDGMMQVMRIEMETTLGRAVARRR